MTNCQYKGNELPSKIFGTFFHKSKNEQIIKSFLEGILNQNIFHFILNNSSVNNLDADIELEENLYLNLKMHVISKDILIQRLLSYWSKDIPVSTQTYKNIYIIFTDFPIVNLEKLQYFTKWKTAKSNGIKIISTDFMKIYIIQVNIMFDNVLDCIRYFEFSQFNLTNENVMLKNTSDKIREYKNVNGLFNFGQSFLYN